MTYYQVHRWKNYISIPQLRFCTSTNDWEKALRDIAASIKNYDEGCEIVAVYNSFGELRWHKGGYKDNSSKASLVKLRLNLWLLICVAASLLPIALAILSHL
jgi:hypothetical protein